MSGTFWLIELLDGDLGQLAHPGIDAVRADQDVEPAVQLDHAADQLAHVGFVGDVTDVSAHVRAGVQAPDSDVEGAPAPRRTATTAPAPTNASATPSPIPRAPPVTTATRPARSTE
jgi:hypothetical protein